MEITGSIMESHRVFLKKVSKVCLAAAFVKRWPTEIEPEMPDIP